MFDRDADPRRFTHLAGLMFGLCALIYSGCNLEGPGGCTSNADCRGNRLCASSGTCLPPGAVDRDASSGDIFESTPDVTGELSVAAITLRDRCAPADQRIVEFEFAFADGLTCGGRTAPFIRVVFESPGWGQSPGDVEAGTSDGTGDMEICIEEGDCLTSGEAIITLDRYSVGDGVVQGSYTLSLPDLASVPDQYTGDRDGNFSEIEICSGQPATCG